jgi:hypothetical protein
VTYLLAFSIGAAAFVIGLFTTAVVLSTFLRYRNQLAGQRYLIFLSLIIAISVAVPFGSISVGAVLTPLSASWVAMSIAIGAVMGSAGGMVIAALAKRGFLRPPKEYWWDIKLQ